MLLTLASEDLCTHYVGGGDYVSGAYYEVLQVCIQCLVSVTLPAPLSSVALTAPAPLEPYALERLLTSTTRAARP